MRRRTSMDSFSTSWPATRARPLEAGMKHARMRMVVDLPAPLGPRKPTIWPGATLNDTSRMAATGP